MKKISILGSTGSIGRQTLEVISAFPEQFDVVGLSCRANIDLLLEQIKVHQPKMVVVDNAHDADTVKQSFPDCQIGLQNQGLLHLVSEPCDLLVVAIVGTASLEPTAKAIENGVTIGLACKEVLVSAGKIIMEMAKAHHVEILPIDSEHAAIKQCLSSVNENMSEVDSLILTASGGPFFKKDASEFHKITSKDALQHPNWDMGAKITIDSATLMNKGLEVMEAHHLFQMPYDKIKVVIHPQSIVHSLVEFKDGTLLSQMGLPDMRFPIQYVLAYPEKWENPWPKTNLTDLQNLEFHEPDTDKFPLLQLAYDVGAKGGNAPAILNAANEVAVQLFLDQKIGFLDIATHIQETLDQTPFDPNPNLADIIALDLEIKARGQYASTR